MHEWTASLALWRWPVALVISSWVLGRTLMLIARSGIKVEIITRRPILISTGAQPIQAAVEKVRI